VELTYRKDKHLDFLEFQDSDKLDVLVRVLIYDKDGDKRYTEELSKYIKDKPNRRECWDLVAAEYQRFGGNSIVNFFRSKGIFYDEILTDVCDKMKITNKNETVDEKEKKLLSEIMKDVWEEMNEKEREEFLRDLNIDITDFSKQEPFLAIQTAIRSSGFLAYQFAVIIANIVAKQILGYGLISFAVNVGMIRAIGVMVGPAGLAITGIWSLVDISGAAYRVTIPATIYIAALRQAELNKNDFEIKCPNCGAIILDRDVNICQQCREEYI